MWRGAEAETLLDGSWKESGVVSRTVDGGHQAGGLAGEGERAIEPGELIRVLVSMQDLERIGISRVHEVCCEGIEVLSVDAR